MKARTTSASSDEINTDVFTAPPTTEPDMTEDTNPIALDRNLYKSIKKMDRATLESLIQDIYESGRRKGKAEALKEAENDSHTNEPKINLDLRELEKQIKAVKGVGAKRAVEIMGIVEKWLGVD